MVAGISLAPFNVRYAASEPKTFKMRPENVSASREGRYYWLSCAACPTSPPMYMHLVKASLCINLCYAQGVLPMKTWSGNMAQSHDGTGGRGGGGGDGGRGGGLGGLAWNVGEVLVPPPELVGDPPSKPRGLRAAFRRRAAARRVSRLTSVAPAAAATARRWSCCKSEGGGRAAAPTADAAGSGAAAHCECCCLCREAAAQAVPPRSTSTACSSSPAAPMTVSLRMG